MLSRQQRLAEVPRKSEPKSVRQYHREWRRYLRSPQHWTVCAPTCISSDRNDESLTIRRKPAFNEFTKRAERDRCFECSARLADHNHCRLTIRAGRVSSRAFVEQLQQVRW